MKKTQIIINLILAGAIAFCIYQNMGKKYKTAYIDNNLLISKYKGMKKARENYDKKAAKWQANVDTLFKKFELEFKEYL